MLQKVVHLLFIFFTLVNPAESQQSKLPEVDFYGDSLDFFIPLPDTVDFPEPMTEQQIKRQAAYLDKWNYQQLVDSLLSYKKSTSLMTGFIIN